MLLCFLLVNQVLSPNLYSAYRTTYRLQLELLPQENILHGEMVVGLRNLSDAPLTELAFYLAANQFHNHQSPAFQRYQELMSETSWLHIDSLWINGHLLSDWTDHTPVMHLRLQSALKPGDSLSVRCLYSVYLPLSRQAFVPSRTKELYRLIHFYPRLLLPPYPTQPLELLRMPPVDFALYHCEITIPQGYRLVGSLSPDTTIDFKDDRQLIRFQPAYCQEIAFLSTPALRRLHLKSQRQRLSLLTFSRRTLPEQERIFLSIANDILNYYHRFIAEPLESITIFPTEIRGGYSATNFILLDKECFQGVTKLDYFSVYTLAELLAEQYLGFDNRSPDSLISINNGFANFAAQKFLDDNYDALRTRYKLAERISTTISRRLLSLLFAGLEKENILQPTGPATNINAQFISTQSQSYFSVKYIQTVHLLAGDSLLKKILANYRQYLFANRPSLSAFNRLVATYTDFDLTRLADYLRQSRCGPDCGIQRVKTTQSAGRYQVTIILKQQPPLSLRLPLRMVNQDHQVFLDTIVTKAQKYDTIRYQLTRPIKKITIDPQYSIWDRQRLNNHYPRNYTFNFLAGLPQVDTYQIFYYPTFDFNRNDWVRPGLKFHSRYWINLQPLLPSRSMDEWSIALNYGYQSHTWGYQLSYSTAILAPILKPRLYLRWRDFYGLEEGKVFTTFYPGKIQYPVLNRISGFQKINLGIEYQNIHTLQFLNANNWEKGLMVAPALEYLNFHNWGRWRHILQVNAKFGLPVAGSDFQFARYAVDFQIRYRFTARNWYSQRLFAGTTRGRIPRQELFYFFGKNVLENTSFESYRLARGEGDMRGYGKQQYKGQHIFTGSTEWRFTLMGREEASLDLLAFYDIGILPPEGRQVLCRDWKTDAGLGLDADLLNLLRLGLHFPFWVSEPPHGEPHWHWRWVVAFDFTI